MDSVNKKTKPNQTSRKHSADSKRVEKTIKYTRMETKEK